MKKMKRIRCHLAAIVFLLPMVHSYGQVQYTAEKFVDMAKIAPKIATLDKRFFESDVKRVIITEFFGEFVVSQSTEPSAFEKNHSDWYTVRKSEVEIGSDFYETVVNQVYYEFVKLLTECGYEVVHKDTLIENPDYIAVGLKEVKTGRQYSGGIAKESTSAQVIKRSASGMGMFSESLNVPQVGKINQILPKIAYDNKADAAIMVKFRIGMQSSGKPSLDYFNTYANTNIVISGSGKNTYYFFKKTYGSFNSANQLTNDAPVFSGGQVDIEAYNNSMMDMVKGMMQAFQYQFKNMKK